MDQVVESSVQTAQAWFCVIAAASLFFGFVAMLPRQVRDLIILAAAALALLIIALHRNATF